MKEQLERRDKILPVATDWDKYYTGVPITARLTRKYTTSVLLRQIGRFASGNSGAPLSIVEIGGANSCFVDSILTAFSPKSYAVFDTNQYGLTLLERRLNGPKSKVVSLHQESVLSMPEALQADLVFSVGLVEHFNPDMTQAAIRAHFRILRPGGIAMITFPTPTPLYRVTRRLLEIFGMWQFPDERPLEFKEVLSTVREGADVVAIRTLWPLILTQGLVVARKLMLTPDRLSD